MKLLVDEDTQAHRLLSMLRQAGFDIVCVANQLHILNHWR